ARTLADRIPLQETGARQPQRAAGPAPDTARSGDPARGLAHGAGGPTNSTPRRLWQHLRPLRRARAARAAGRGDGSAGAPPVRPCRFAQTPLSLRTAYLLAADRTRTGPSQDSCPGVRDRPGPTRRPRPGGPCGDARVFLARPLRVLAGRDRRRLLGPAHP